MPCCQLGFRLKARFLLSLGLFFFCLVPLRAAIVPHLYEASLTYQTQTSEEKQTLLQQGLLQVLERISGQTQLKDKIPVKRALTHINEYVEQYTYQGSALKVKYSTDQVNQLVYEMGHTVWGQRRPKVIVWLAIEEQKKRRLVGSESDPHIQKLVTKVAERKGLPLLLPLLDLEDVAAINVTDVWGQFPSVLTQISQRYGAQTILVGRIVHTTGSAESWQANWQLLLDNEMPTWQTQGPTLEAILEEGITQVTHYLIGNMSEKNNLPIQQAMHQPLLLAVQNIRSATDFAKVEAYLNSLSEIMHVEIQQVAGDMAIFALTIQGENARQALEQHIHRDQYLSVGISSGFEQVDLVYRLGLFSAHKVMTTPEAEISIEEPLLETTDEVIEAEEPIESLPTEDLMEPIDSD